MVSGTESFYAAYPPFGKPILIRQTKPQHLLCSESCYTYLTAEVEAAFDAYTSGYQLLRPVLLELKRRHPETGHDQLPDITPRRNVPRQSRCAFGLTFKVPDASICAISLAA
jgi:hypothetical protein